MLSSPQIVFRNCPPSSAVAEAIVRRLEGLESVGGPISRCRVLVELPHRHKRHGNLFRVHIVATLQEGAIVIDREPGANGAHEDVYTAVRDAFDAAERKAYARHHQWEQRRRSRVASGV